MEGMQVEIGSIIRLYWITYMEKEFTVQEEYDANSDSTRWEVVSTDDRLIPKELKEKLIQASEEFRDKK